MTTAIINAIETFIARLTEEAAADPFFADMPDQRPTFGLSKPGHNYVRIIAKPDTCHASAWGFVELATGDIFKAAGWSKPAKHARGNIADAEYGRNYVWTGPRYLR